MKIRILALFLALVTAASLLTSCSLIFGDVDDSGNFTVLVENADGSYEVYTTDLNRLENKSEGAKGLLEHLNTQNERLYLEMVDSTYGAYVSAIGNIREGDGYYVIVYTSVASDSYEGAPTVEYEDTTLYQAGVGLSGMKVEAGGIIMFRLERSPY